MAFHSNGSIGKARLIGALAMGVAMVAGGEANAQQQIISAVNVDMVGPDDTRVGTAAGGVATNTAGTDVRATTDYGVNKIFAQGTASNEVYASSAWLDTFTVAGTGMVHLSFTFTIDGAVHGDNASSAWNFKVAALRGDGWSINGGGGWVSTPYGRELDTGTDYDTMILQRTTPGLVTRADARDFDGFYNYANAGGQPGNFASRALRDTGPLGEYYEIVTANGPNVTTQRLYENFFQRSINGGAFQTFGYDNAAAGGPQLLAAYNNVKANYSLIAAGALCPEDECSTTSTGMTVIDPTSFTLDFDLAAGSQFALASWLYADDVDDGTVDFFNTAKITGVTVSAGASLASASGALTPLPGGGYGYPAAAPGAGAVPEPATWAMMIMGFGAIGGAMRRRRAAPTVLAA